MEGNLLAPSILGMSKPYVKGKITKITKKEGGDSAGALTSRH